MKSIYGGIEISRRDLDVPIQNFQSFTVDIEDREQNLFDAYLYWTPHPNWALTAAYQYDKIERDAQPGDDAPEELETATIPLAVRYFHPVGLFSEVGVTFLHQDVERAPGSSFDEGTETVALVDLAAGYRLPNRRGIFRLEVRNLLDKEFNFQDVNFFTSETRVPEFTPDLTIFAEATLRF